jgi:hypothetical protein
MDEQHMPSQGPDDWQPTPPPRRRASLGLKVGLVGAGLVAGAALAGTMTAQAATTTATPTPTSTSSTSPQAHGDGDGDGPSGGHGGALSLSGTVTALGSSTVTIKTSTGTTTYSTTSGSDIDKNGEATLGTLAVGDAVTFDTTTSGGTVIDKLHAGNEQLDRHQGAPGAPPTGGADTGGGQQQG